MWFRQLNSETGETEVYYSQMAQWIFLYILYLFSHMVFPLAADKAIKPLVFMQRVAELYNQDNKGNYYKWHYMVM